MQPATFVATVRTSGKTTKTIYIPKAVSDTLKLRHGQAVDITRVAKESPLIYEWDELA